MNAGPILIMAGGTGGHVFPGLAVAEVLRERAAVVIWMGTHRGMEARLVPRAGIEMEWISIAGFRGRGLIAWLLVPFQLCIAVCQALRVFRRCRPAAILGLGGFVSAPGGLAAWLIGRPLLIHEQNAVAGTTNRLLARFACRVFEAFPNSFGSTVQAELVGNPVRRSIVALPPPRQRLGQRQARPRVLVLGGSQGARVLNKTLPIAFSRLPADIRPEVWHQAGKGLSQAEAAYAEVNFVAKVENFVRDMAKAYGWADLVVSRAGALTISELSAAGIGALLIPYAHAIDDHQMKNANRFVSRGAGVVIPESELDIRRLTRELECLLGNRERLLELAENAREQSKGHAAARLADACLEFTGPIP